MPKGHSECIVGKPSLVRYQDWEGFELNLRSFFGSSSSPARRSPTNKTWPTWDLPILRWGKSQKAIVKFAHSGFGLEVKSSDLPNYEMPGWCLAAVDQCWTQKAPKISARELPDARQAYDHAREVYRKLITESDKQ
jgi:hypothetical protein